MPKINKYNFVMTGFLAALYVPAAHAYIDPGTGALVVQAAIGAIATALVTVKYWWSKVTTAVRGFFPSR
ncbi:MAG: hypothetical protein AAF296_04165 [Pseudomonadota bacterium]